MRGIHEMVSPQSEFPPIHCPYCGATLRFEDLVNGEDYGSGRYNGCRIFWLDWDVSCPHCHEEFEIGLQGIPDTIEVHAYGEDGDSVYIDYNVHSGEREVQ